MTEVANSELMLREDRRLAWIKAHGQVVLNERTLRRASIILGGFMAVLLGAVIGMSTLGATLEAGSSWSVVYVLVMFLMFLVGTLHITKTVDVFGPIRSSHRAFQGMYYTPAINDYMELRAPELERLWSKGKRPRNDDDDTIVWVDPRRPDVMVEFTHGENRYLVYGVATDRNLKPVYIEAKTSAEVRAILDGPARTS